MKNLLGFVKENKNTIGIIAGAIASIIVAKKVNRKINTKIEKVEKEYEEMKEVIETTHEMNLPEYSEEDYNNDTRINTTKKVIKSICLKACKMISSAPLPILVFLMGCLQQRAIVLNGDDSPQGEKAADFILIFPTLFLWKKLYKLS